MSPSLLAVALPLHLMTAREKLIKPAIRHVIQSIAALLPAARCDWLQDYSEPLALLLVGILEAYHLLCRSLVSTWTEGLYGLTRVSSATGSKGSAQPSPAQRSLSLAYILLMPKLIYFLQSIKSNAMSAGDSPPAAGSTWSALLHGLRICRARLLSMLAPLGDALHIAEQTSTMAFRMAYLMGLSSYHHPVFAALGLQMVKTRSLDQGHEASSTNGLMMKLIVGAMFAMKAAEWLAQNDLSEFHLSRRLAPPLIVPPPPRPSNVCTGGLMSNSKGLCAVCCRPRSDPCAASSGFVFCYLCLLQAVREKGCCPITGMPCAEKDIVRLFEH